MKQAQEGIKELAQYVDSIMVIPNENLKYVTEEKITLLNAFEIANDVLRQGVQSVSDLVNATGLVNCDFADVTEIMKDSGYAHMVLAVLGVRIKQNSRCSAGYFFTSS